MKKYLIVFLSFLIFSTAAFGVPLTQGAQYTAIGGHPLCTTPHVAQGSCTTTFTWPIAFSDNNYSANCTLLGPTTGCSPGACVWIASISHTATQITITLSTGTASQSQFSTAPGINCIGVHL